MTRKRLLGYTLLLVWMAVIFYVSSEPAAVSSERSDAITRVIKTVGSSVDEDTLTFLTRKSAHIVAYFILGLLIFNVLRNTRRKPHILIPAAIIFCCLYAISDEVHQTYVDGRSGEVRDVIIDTTASAASIVPFALIQQRRK